MKHSRVSGLPISHSQGEWQQLMVFLSETLQYLNTQLSPPCPSFWNSSVHVYSWALRQPDHRTWGGPRNQHTEPKAGLKVKDRTSKWYGILALIVWRHANIPTHMHVIHFPKPPYYLFSTTFQLWDQNQLSRAKRVPRILKLHQNERLPETVPPPIFTGFKAPKPSQLRIKHASESLAPIMYSFLLSKSSFPQPPLLFNPTEEVVSVLL